MKIKLRQILESNFENKFNRLSNSENGQKALLAAGAIPAAGFLVGGAIGNTITGNGDMTPTEALKLSSINPDEYNQRIDDDEYDMTGATLGALVAGGLGSKKIFNTNTICYNRINRIFNTIRNKRSFDEKVKDKFNDTFAK